MARDLISEQNDLSRRSRIPEPPFEPTSVAVHKTYYEVMYGLAEEVWVLPGTQALALQIAETTITLNRINVAISISPLVDEDGKPPQIYRLALSYSDTLAKLYSKLRALPVALNDPSLAKRSLTQQKRGNTGEKVGSDPFGSLIPRGTAN